MNTNFSTTPEFTDLTPAAQRHAAADGLRADGVDVHLAPLNYWLPGELTAPALSFDRLELPREGDLAP